MSRDWTDSLAALAGTDQVTGVAPPTLLRSRPIEDAQEVLICTYTSDLRFFESTCLTEARAMRARVTVVRDVDQGGPMEAVRHAGNHYTDVPVRCRSGGAFHPKLVVVAGADRAVVAIGSGNMTASGWHHNAEMWTVLAATATDWPATFTDLAEWLRRLPGHLHLDPFGAGRIREVAALLSRHPARATGPRLVHNLDRPVIHAIPDLSRSLAAGVDELGMASPFLDAEGVALTEVTRRLAPARATLALTVNAVGPTGPLTRWRSDSRQVVAVEGERYHHGKLVEWRVGGSHTALVGSANLTSAALLRRAGDHAGNCELGLLLNLDGTLLPTASDEPVTDLGEHLTETGEREDAAPAACLLRVLTDGTATTVHVLVPSPGDRPTAGVGGQADGVRLRAQNLSAPLFTVVPESASEPAPASGTGSAIWTMRAGVAVAAATPCRVELPDGSVLGPVPATDATAVGLRPGAASPLEDATLAHVLSDSRLADRLFKALAELAQLRSGPAPGVGHGTAGRVTWRTHAERIAGPALITLALGRHGPTPLISEDRILDRAMDTDSAGPDRDAADPDDDTTWETDDESQLDISDHWSPEHDPVSLLRQDPVTAARLARRVELLTTRLDDWSLPALLALTKVALIIAAGDGWDADRWPDVLADLLAHLAPTTAETAADLETSRYAAAVTGLAALADRVEDWDRPSEARTRFDRTRGLLGLHYEPLDDGLLEHYAADLDIGLGPNLTPAAIQDSAAILLDDPLTRLVEDLRDRHPTVRLATPRLIEIEAPTPGLIPLLRLLNRCSDYPPVAVRIHTPTGDVFAAWMPKVLVVQYDQVRRQHGAEYQLAVGLGAHTNGTLPRAVASWSGPLPAEMAERLRDQRLLE